MSRKACAVAISFGLLAAVAGFKAFGADSRGVDAKAAFARLKSLEGPWTLVSDEAGHGSADRPMSVAYKVTAAGSVVMETLFAATDHGMVSMDHLDGDDLRLTHDCVAENQPHLKLDRTASTPDLLVFAFEGGTGFDPDKDMHMHSGRIEFVDGKHVESEWQGYEGREKAHAAEFALSRP